MEKVDPTESDFSRSKTLGSWWFARHRSHIGSKKSHPMHQPRKIDKRSDLRFVFSFWLWPLLLGLWCISSRHLALDERNLWLHWSQHKVSGSSNTFKWKSSFCTNPSACTLDGNSQSTACRCPFFCSLWLHSKSMQKYAKWSKWICPQNVCLLKLKCVLLVAEGLSISGTCWWASIAVPLVHMVHPWKNWGMLEHPDPRQRHGSYQKVHWPFDAKFQEIHELSTTFNC